MVIFRLVVGAVGIPAFPDTGGGVVGAVGIDDPSGIGFHLVEDQDVAARHRAHRDLDGGVGATFVRLQREIEFEHVTAQGSVAGDRELEVRRVAGVGVTGSQETEGGGGNKSSYTVKGMEGNLQASENFSLDQCELKEFQLELRSDDGGDGGSCNLLPKGDPCDNDAECCSGKCKGPAGGKTCK